MIAKILVSPNLESRKSWSEQFLTEHGLAHNHPDVLWIEDGEKLGVEKAKEIREFLSIKAYSGEGRAVILESAHDLTVEAQNSLLKTLEEPPREAMILLGVESENKMLGTVLSRCQIVVLDNPLTVILNDLSEGSRDSSPVPQNDISRVLDSSLEERFQYIEKLEEKEEFLRELVIYYRKKLSEDPKNVKFAKLLVQAEQWDRSNVNLRAILEYLMLELD